MEKPDNGKSAGNRLFELHDRVRSARGSKLQRRG